MRCRGRGLAAVAALVTTATFGLAVDQAVAADAAVSARSATAVTRTVAAKPKLVRGAAAKKIILAAFANIDKHGPYRMTMSVAFALQKGAKPVPLTVSTTDVVPPDRVHTWIGPVGTGPEIIVIGNQAWEHLDPKGDWQHVEGVPSRFKRSGGSPLKAKDLASAAEVRSKDKTLRLFKIVSIERSGKVTKTTRGTVVVDRQGRLRSVFLAAADGSSMRLTISYNPKIVVRPPA